MPLFAPKPKAQAPTLDPSEWRPQQFARGMRNLPDAIVEPYWRGVRVLAWVGTAGTRFVDEDGVDCTKEFAEVGRQLIESLDASELVLDGFLTVEPTQDTVGLGDPGMNMPTGRQVMAQMLLGGKVMGNGDRNDPTRRLDPTAPIAFVAVDILSIDGSSLLDVPLLERKRLLDGALKPSDRVRVTPFVRAPVGSFAVTWRNLGFTELAYKSANGHYAPGGLSEDWFLALMPRR